MRPAYYALSAGGWRDYVTLLHIPFTIWHLSYVVLGAAAAPTIHLDRVGWTVLAFFLAVGLGAHALDEYQGRPLRTRIGNRKLLALAALSLSGALFIGVYASLIINLWTLAFVSLGIFIVVAYNLEFWAGRFHTDIWFGLSWGAFPVLVGYWASAERLEIKIGLIAGACFALSLAQRKLSNRARRMRRESRSVTGTIEYMNGQVETITISRLIDMPEVVMRLLGVTITLLALGWLIAGLYG